MEILSAVFNNIPQNKSFGPDHWHPNEVRLLPKMFKRNLIDIMQQSEVGGRWPENLRYSTVTLTPKTKAVHEGQVGPIGGLPMIYRIWM